MNKLETLIMRDLPEDLEGYLLERVSRGITIALPHSSPAATEAAPRGKVSDDASIYGDVVALTQTTTSSTGGAYSPRTAAPSSGATAQQHVLTLPTTVDAVGIAALRRLERLVLNHTPEDVESFLTEHLTKIVPEAATIASRFAQKTTQFAGAPRVVAQVEARFVEVAVQQRRVSTQVTDIVDRRTTVSLPETIGDTSTRAIRKLEAAVIAEAPPDDSLEDYLLSRLQRQFVAPQTPGLCREVMEPPAHRYVGVVENVAATVDVSLESVSPKKHDDSGSRGLARFLVSNDALQASSSPSAARRAASVGEAPKRTASAVRVDSSRNHNHRYESERISPPRFRHRSPRDLLSPPDASLLAEYAAYRSSPLRSLRRYQQVTDPMRDLSVVASGGIAARRRSQHHDHVGDTGVAVTHHYAQQHPQPYQSSPYHTGVGRASYEDSGSPHYAGVQLSHHERTARKEQDAMALRHEFDEMIRREAERNLRLQQEVESLRAAREYDALAKDRETEHQRRMIAILAAEESAKAHSHAQRRLIELSAKGRELANEIERRASSPARPHHLPHANGNSPDGQIDRLTERQRLELHLYSVQKQKVLHTSRALGIAQQRHDNNYDDDPRGNYPLVHDHHHIAPSSFGRFSASPSSGRFLTSPPGTAGPHSSPLPQQHHNTARDVLSPYASAATALQQNAFVIPSHFTPVKSSPRPFLQGYHR